jgi:ferredoxin-NADP reductase
MTGPDPMEHLWWLVSRASGVVALVLMAASVAAGLAMAGRATRVPLLALHRQAALAALVALAVHGITLLGDPFLAPAPAEIAIPFLIDHEPVWTGLGVTAGWLAAALGLSYGLRDRIGARRWLVLHRFTLVAYVLSVAHTLGAGTDAAAPWMRVLVVATGAPVLFLLVVRLLPAERRLALRVAGVVPESARVTSFELVPARRGRRLPRARAGQAIELELEVPGHGRLRRTYSLSAAPGRRRWRISVARDGVGSAHLHDAVGPGDVLRAAPPRGDFVLAGGRGPVVLLSAGVGATPVLAMLDSLAARGDRREVWWLHVARRPAEHAFAAEARALVDRLPRGRHRVWLTERDGRPTAGDVLALGVPREAAFHLCGAAPFVAAMTDGLHAAGVSAIASEAFGGGAGAPVPSVTFARSGVTTPWAGGTLQELADAHAIPTGASCRSGSCLGCRTPVVAGAVRHSARAAPPAAGTALLCCAQPDGDVVLDA